MFQVHTDNAHVNKSRDLALCTVCRCQMLLQACCLKMPESSAHFLCIREINALTELIS